MAAKPLFFYLFLIQGQWKDRERGKKIKIKEGANSATDLRSNMFFLGNTVKHYVQQ